MLRCRFAILLYLADISEAKECISIRYGVITLIPCPRCVAPRQDMNLLCQYPFQNIEDISSTTSDLNSHNIKSPKKS